MLRKKLFFVIAFYIAIDSPGGAQQRSSEFTVDSLESIRESSAYFPFAQYRLAEIFVLRNSVSARKDAEVFIRKALAADPDNLDFQIILIRILYERGFYGDVNNACDKIISNRLQPGQGNYFAEAYFYKGLVTEKQALKYRDMKSFVFNSNQKDVAVELSLSHYGEDAMKEAARNYETALGYYSDHRDALHHLGLLYFEIKNYEIMAKLFERSLALNHGDKDALIFDALGYYHLGQLEKADAYYQKAMNLMSEEEYGEFNFIGYIVPANEMKEYMKGEWSPSKAYTFEKEFWRKKDPLYLTRYNERLIEHYNRMAYVNLRFGVPRLNLHGWNTERGMIYIRYGEPYRAFKTQPDEHFLGGKETWVYPGYSFTFEDDYASGKFMLDNRSFAAARVAYHDSEEWSDYAKKSLHVDSHAYQFRGEKGAIKLKCFYAVNKNQFDTTLFSQGKNLDATGGLFVMDPHFEIIAETRSSLQLNKIAQFENQFFGSFEIDRLSFDSSYRNYSLELQTTADQRFASYRGQIRFYNFSGDQLQMSDVIAARQILSQKELILFPNFDLTTSRNTDVYLYFEVYNLMLNKDSKSQYKVETAIQAKDKTGVSKILSGFFGREQKNRTTASFDVTAKRRDDQYYFAVNVSDVPPGFYDLTVRITDSLSGQTAGRTVSLKITE